MVVFSRNPVEISEVLPVEISTMKSDMNKNFAGKKIMSFGPTVEILKQNLVPPPWPVLDAASLISKSEMCALILSIFTNFDVRDFRVLGLRY